MGFWINPLGLLGFTQLQRERETKERTGQQRCPVPARPRGRRRGGGSPAAIPAAGGDGSPSDRGNEREMVRERKSNHIPMEKTNKKRSQKERNRDCSKNPIIFQWRRLIRRGARKKETEIAAITHMNSTRQHLSNLKLENPKTDKGYISDNPRQTFMWGREERGFREVERVV